MQQTKMLQKMDVVDKQHDNKTIFDEISSSISAQNLLLLKITFLPNKKHPRILYISSSLHHIQINFFVYILSLFIPNGYSRYHRGIGFSVPVLPTKPIFLFYMFTPSFNLANNKGSALSIQNSPQISHYMIYIF